MPRRPRFASHRIAFWCLLVLALLGIGVAVIIGTASGDAPGARNVNEDASFAPDNSKPSATTRPLDHSTARSDVPEAPQQDSPLNESTMTVVFVEYDGAQRVAVAGLAVEIRTGALDQPGAQDAYYTDDQGNVVKRVASGSTVRITLKSPSWRFAATTEGGGVSSKSMYVTGDSYKIELLVERISVFSVSVVYEDGHAYAGLATVSADTGAPRPVLVTEGERVVLTLPSRQTWTLFAPARRPGFTGGEVKLGDHADEPKFDTLTLPRFERAAGVFEVQCSNFPPAALVNIRIATKGESVSIAALDEVDDWPADRPYCSTPLDPGTYEISVQLSRRSPGANVGVGVEVAELFAGQIQPVRVSLMQPGSVRLLVVDGDNAPIPRARLAHANSTYFNWGWASDHPPGYQHIGSDSFALSNEHGVVILPGLLPGPLELLCDAQGYGRIILQAHVLAGSETDLGTVQLSRATGVIRIEILHPEAADDDEYEVMLLKPGAGIVRSAERFSGKSHQIDALDLLTYAVSIRYVAGGYGAFSRQVTLTEENPQADVTFRMQKPPLVRD